MSLDRFDKGDISNQEDQDENIALTQKNIQQTKQDIRKSKISLRISKAQIAQASQINVQQSQLDLNGKQTLLQIRPSTIYDQGLYQHNPEDVYTPQEHAEAIQHIQEFVKATNNLNDNLPIYDIVKEYCKNRKNRQLLILNDFHLYLRDAYMAKFGKQQTILEIIYQISLEKDFCDELALLGGLIDEAFVFLQTHLKSYNKIDVDDYYNRQNKDSLNQHNVEIIDSATLLKLDLWIRIISNFCKNDQVIDYVANNKEDFIKYMLVFLQNIDTVIKKNPNLSSINSVIIASTVKTGVLEAMFLVTQIDEMKRKVIFNQQYFSAIYLNLLKKTSNQTIFSNLCKLMSQLAQSDKFPIHILGLNIIEDFLLSYMMRTIYNVGLPNSDPQDTSQSLWSSIQQERESRQNFLAEVWLARTFFYLTTNSHQRKLLMKSINGYEDHVLFRFLFKCFSNNLFEAQIYMLLGLTQLAQKEQLQATKDYHKQIVMYIYQQCEQVYIEKDAKDDKQKMLITILMTRFIKFLNFNKQEIEKILELMNVKLNNSLKVPGTITEPVIVDQYLLQQMQTKKTKKYEQNDEVYQKEVMGYNVQGLVIQERPYNDSVDYSRLISEMSEGDFEDSLLEDQIYHLRLNFSSKNNPIENKKTANIKKKEIFDSENQLFNFEKLFYSKYKNQNENEIKKQNQQQLLNNSFLKEQQMLIDQKKYITKEEQALNQESISFGLTPMARNQAQINPASFNISAIQNDKDIKSNNQSYELIKQDLNIMNSNQKGNPSKFKQNAQNQQSLSSIQDIKNENEIIDKINNISQNNQLENQFIQQPISENINFNKRKSSLNTQKYPKQVNQIIEKQDQIPLYLNEKKQCFMFHQHYQRRCEYCQSIFYSFFDQPSILVEQWIFNSQDCSFDDVFQIDFFYENFIQIIHSLFYFSMVVKGEIPFSVLKQTCIVLADENKIYADRRYKAAIILLLSHIVKINPSYVSRLIQINFLSVQDFILTQFLNCFGYKTFNLIKLIKRGTGTVNKQPIFEQVQRRGSKLSSLNEEDLEGEQKDNIYENFLVQSTLQLEFDGTQFNASEVTLSVKQSAEFLKQNQDKEIDNPEHLQKENYTDYYLQLHSIQHILDLSYKLFKYAIKQKNELVLEGAPNLIEQLIYLLIFFNDINSYEYPRIPFYINTKCWRQNKLLIQKGFSNVVNIIKQFLIQKQVVTEYYKIQQNSPHLLDIIKMAEFFPSFKGCILLFQIVYYIYKYKSVQRKSFDNYDLQCFCAGLKSSALAQKLHLESKKKLLSYDVKMLQKFLKNRNDEQNVGRILKFQIICLQFFCSFQGQEMLKTIKKEGYQNLELYLSEIFTILELCKKLQFIIYKNNLNVQSMQDLVINGQKIENQVQNENIKDDNSQQYKTVGNLENLVNDFQSSLMLFLSMLCEYRNFSDTILSHQTFQYIMKNIKHLNLSNEAQFCFTGTIHSLAKTNACLDNLQKQYKEFSKDLTLLLYQGRINKNNLMPLFRSVRILLQNRHQDSQYFREMIPKLREYAEISQNKNKDFKKLEENLGNLNISQINQNAENNINQQQKIKSQENNQSFINQQSFVQMLHVNGKKPVESFLDNDEMTFLQNMKDENESAVQNVNETVSILNKNKKLQDMSKVEKKQFFQEMFVKESRLLLKLLVVISENELKQKIKDMQLNKEFKIDEAGTLSKKTQKQQIDYEEKKKNIIQLPHNESSIYGYDVKVNYELPLSRVPDFYKKSAYELYEERKKLKEKQQMRDNEPIPIIQLKDDSDSTLIRIKNAQINDIFEKKPEFLQEKQSIQGQQKHFSQKGFSQEPNKNRYSAQSLQESNDFNKQNGQQVESLAKFMKQQQEKQYYNNANSKNILPADFSSLSSIQQLNKKEINFQLNQNASQQMFKQQKNQSSNILSNDYSVLKSTGQNILLDVDEVYKKMYQKKLFQ
ncbi:hypothetical protein TTHERM_00188490 (macronuclear) [Tetrahymena thermophila SB210]|uniref:Uncharacterized protein n=1 Tax=Tetrahymena thermophila (strain SB210) TaxID=312017 RepID=I7MEF9_TETTS|nr:hypothetical protein TTHERM_00188490 [Tetrahymena thermophila SB210]EAR96280.2 hypothetical protein TTHERM_00188490 [Tetrahymena thermophila SB210]|eukprot:XP_001016525.2 hypothetical protein TTHERM_00188490 [Tetrahymena thermophila SB210]